MARGGINKHLVANARSNLLAKGIHPSIDAVRKELGDTGSKTTIHRYLKEIEEKEGIQLADEALLSTTLRAMVSKLASQLKHEASDIVVREKKEHDQIQAKLRASLNDKDKTLVEANQKNKDLRSEYEELDKRHSALESGQTALKVESERLKQQIKDQQELLESQKSYIDSLEDKHQQARNALEHYRESVKEQREQDSRKHEHGKQQLQMEIRDLRQTISIKQSDLTHLNTENAKLITKVAVSNKQINRLETNLSNTQASLEATSNKLADREALLGVEKEKILQLKDDKATLENTVQLLTDDVRQQEIELASLRSDLSAKNSLFDQLIGQVKNLEPRKN